jgi:2-polyprenyl-6-hydroxyphenyl methylase/3-demethylubiquinone-9 3-methyltransferase
MSHEREIREGQRFAFGKNWLQFLQVLTEERIAEAERSLIEALEVNDLNGKSFLDIGCGSGLFSLAARRLGSRVCSLDYDPQSVACAVGLKRRYYPHDPDWIIAEASVLDEPYLRSLGTFDVVYSWGVLHHTGALWQALKNCTLPVTKGGQLYIAIYNFQLLWTAPNTVMKRTYVRAPLLGKYLILAGFAVTQLMKGVAKDLLFRRNPLARYRRNKRERGMSVWYDWVDWVGGYPFEAAKPEEIFHFVKKEGFTLEKLKTCGGGPGCNEFVFRKL